MNIDYLSDDGEPESRASGFTRTTFVNPIEPLGKTRQVSGRDPRAGIVNHEFGMLTPPVPVNGHPRALRCMPDRVEDQIGKRTMQQRFIPQQKQSKLSTYLNGTMRLLPKPLGLLRNFFEHVEHRDRLTLDLLQAILKSRQHEQVADHRSHTTCLLHHSLQRDPAHRLRIFGREQGLQVAANDGQQRSQLV